MTRYRRSRDTYEFFWGVAYFACVYLVLLHYNYGRGNLKARQHYCSFSTKVFVGELRQP